MTVFEWDQLPAPWEEFVQVEWEVLHPEGARLAGARLRQGVKAAFM